MYKPFVIPSRIQVWLCKTKLSNHPKMIHQLQIICETNNIILIAHGKEQGTRGQEHRVQEKAIKGCLNGMMIIQHSKSRITGNQKKNLIWKVFFYLRTAVPIAAVAQQSLLYASHILLIYDFPPLLIAFQGNTLN